MLTNERRKAPRVSDQRQLLRSRYGRIRAHRVLMLMVRLMVVGGHGRWHNVDRRREGCSFGQFGPNATGHCGCGCGWLLGDWWIAQILEVLFRKVRVCCGIFFFFAQVRVVSQSLTARPSVHKSLFVRHTSFGWTRGTRIAVRH